MRSTRSMVPMLRIIALTPCGWNACIVRRPRLRMLAMDQAFAIACSLGVKAHEEHCMGAERALGNQLRDRVRRRTQEGWIRPPTAKLRSPKERRLRIQFLGGTGTVPGTSRRCRSAALKNRPAPWRLRAARMV